MHGEPRVVCQPRPHLRVLMSAVVVRDDMHIQFSRDALVDLLEKGKELLVTMPGFAVGQERFRLPYPGLQTSVVVP